MNDAPTAVVKLQQTISRLAAEQARLIVREADLDREGERIKRVTDEVQRDLNASSRSPSSEAIPHRSPHCCRNAWFLRPHPKCSRSGRQLSTRGN